MIEAIELEHELCRIPGVTAARVVMDPEDVPVEVHVLATTDKHAKQLVRDVQSVAITTFGLDIDRRVVSVVQVQEACALGHAGQVRPCTEGLVAGAGQDHHAYRGVRLRLGHRLPEAGGHAPRDGVAALGPVDRHPGHAVGHLVENLIGHEAGR